MTAPGFNQKIFLQLAALLIVNVSLAQVNIKGTIYDRSLRIGLQGVTVTSSSGKNAVTDKKGNYQIVLALTDSIYFSYLNKRTSPFPVRSIEYPQQFDMSLDVATDSLPPVTVWSKNYYEDSLENREEYAKIFNYGAPDVLSTGTRNNQATSGFDLDFFFNMAKGRRMEAFQRRLIADEQDKYVNHRFTKTLVTRITGLQSPMLDSFMRQYWPTYSFIQACETDYDYYKYILECSKWFREDWYALHPDLKRGQPDSLQAAGNIN